MYFTRNTASGSAAALVGLDISSAFHTIDPLLLFNILFYDFEKK